jgi:hypothetical protein
MYITILYGALIILFQNTAHFLHDGYSFFYIHLIFTSILPGWSKCYFKVDKNYRLQKCNNVLKLSDNKSYTRYVHVQCNTRLKSITKVVASLTTVKINKVTVGDR